MKDKAFYITRLTILEVFIFLFVWLAVYPPQMGHSAITIPASYESDNSMIVARYNIIRLRQIASQKRKELYAIIKDSTPRKISVYRFDNGRMIKRYAFYIKGKYIIK